jgi:hypothetical protein
MSESGTDVGFKPAGELAPFNSKVSDNIDKAQAKEAPAAKENLTDEQAYAIRDIAQTFIREEQSKKIVIVAIVIICLILIAYFVYIIIRLNQTDLNGVWNREEGAEPVTLIHNRITGTLNSVDGKIKADISISGHLDFCKPFSAVGKVEDGRIVIGMGKEVWKKN